MRIVCVIVLLIIAAVSADTLTVQITNVQGDKGGELLLFVYTQKSWMKVESAHYRLPVVADESEYSFEVGTVPAEAFAIRVVHDEDGDGKLKMKWFPPGPTEGYGFSNGYSPRGIPSYEKAEIDQKTSESIEIIYP